MKLLLDTHLLLWIANDSEQLSSSVRALVEDPENELFFSAASIWEVAIKANLGRKDFMLDPRLFRRGLLDNDYSEIPISSEHAVMLNSLPPIHRDPFDRILIAQATVEGIHLVTEDQQIAKYPGPIKKM